MFSITETINSRSDDIEVTPGFDYLTLILTLHQNLQWILKLALISRVVTL